MVRYGKPGNRKISCRGLGRKISLEMKMKKCELSLKEGHSRRRKEHSEQQESVEGAWKPEIGSEPTEHQGEQAEGTVEKEDESHLSEMTTAGLEKYILSQEIVSEILYIRQPAVYALYVKLL